MGSELPDDLFRGDPVEIERGLDDWVAEFERNAARYQELQHRVEDVRVSASSPGGVVTVTVDANGSVVDAKFTERVHRTSPEELGAQLMGAINRAKAEIAGRVREVADDTLGAEAGASADRIVDYYQERFPSTGESAEALPRVDRGEADDGEGDFGGGSIYDRRR
ncbi:YbaB/EbfC family nucleoid-associated protein [Amycolatopsis roodepoortensis]|uniref:DNA-binding protein YbaB n=1 Tax=Amycolatopsis roodepoortensis TaxID=700274 RepID=A0ABR9L8M7_9PSEU|nr:YbaB/EbfC family nucleoid-associated protein [Amycolatopsis roodepoortensis]MBE1576965.1 DNA-binding protein YbaB [Amycolatopsis roodepoortensis]